MSKPDVLDLPDLSFVRYCEEQFYINRGVYNTIEQWFYMRGIVPIKERRKIILLFLENVTQSTQKCVFGAGGLKQHLNLFWTMYYMKKASNS